MTQSGRELLQGAVTLGRPVLSDLEQLAVLLQEVGGTE
jgi:hypothetical protein